VDGGVANADEAELFPRKSLDRFQSHLQLIGSDDILARVDLDGDNLAFVAGFQFGLEALVLPLALALEPVDVIALSHMGSPLVV
jgi:hypothetical protein